MPGARRGDRGAALELLAAADPGRLDELQRPLRTTAVAAPQPDPVAASRA
jgi:hypothetical protein